MDWVQANDEWKFSASTTLWLNTKLGWIYENVKDQVENEEPGTTRDTYRPLFPDVGKARALGFMSGSAVMQGRRAKQEDRHALINDLWSFIENDESLQNLSIPSDSLENPRVSACMFVMLDGHCGSLASQHFLRDLPNRFLKKVFGDAGVLSCPKSGSYANPEFMVSDQEEEKAELEPDRPSGAEESPAESKEQGPDCMGPDRKKQKSDGVGDSFQERLAQSSTIESVKRAFVEAFEEGDAGFLSKYRLAKDGSTATLALLLGNHLYVAGCGDSRAVMGICNDLTVRDATGKSKWSSNRLTVDHKPDLQDERKRIEASGGMVVKIGGCFRVANKDFEERCKRIKLNQCIGQGAVESSPLGLAVSRCLGDSELKKSNLLIATPDVMHTVLDGSQRMMIIASDGLWDTMSDDTSVLIAKDFFPFGSEPAASRLIKSAYKHGSQDNLTCIVVYFAPQLMLDRWVVASSS